MREMPTVLLVDDDEAARYLGHRLLRRLGLHEGVQQASNGQEALELLRAACHAGRPGPVLILLDLNMPVMGGFEFLHAYHTTLPLDCRRAKVVVLSSSEQPQEISRAQVLAADYVSKPLTQEILARLLRDHANYSPLGQDGLAAD